MPGIVRYYGTSAADTNQTVSAPGSGIGDGTATNIRLRVRAVFVAYSAAPTQTGVIITLDSGLGAGYDTVLLTGTANARYTYWTPSDGGDLPIFNDDQIDVLAPQAGGTITSSVSIYCEVPV